MKPNMCEYCGERLATKKYRTIKLCGKCLQTLCLFCSGSGPELVLLNHCPGHDVAFNNKRNRFSSDPQFINEAVYEMDGD